MEIEKGLTLCPSCHRRGSERYGWISTMKMADGTPYTFSTERCPDCFHDLADLAPEAFEVLDILQAYGLILTVEGVTERGITHREAIERARALLARAVGKEEAHDE